MSAATRSSAFATSVTSSGESPFVGSSTSRTRVVVEERPRDRDHLLLAARERAGPLGAAFAQLGEEVVDELVARVRAALGEPEVLRRR